MKRFRVAIVESSHIVVEGLRTIFASESEFELVYVGEELRGLIERMALVQPDVVIIGSQSECGASLRASTAEWRDVALVGLLTTVRSEEWQRQFDGVINLYDSPHQLFQRLRMALEQSQTNPYQDSHELSERERDVLVLVAKGLANKEIADVLNISVHTVISHRKNISHKTGIKSVAGLTVYALLNNLLQESDVMM